MPIDRRSDIFALGRVFEEGLAMACNRPKRHHAGLKGLRSIIATMVARDKHARYRNCVDVARDIKRVIPPRQWKADLHRILGELRSGPDICNKPARGVDIQEAAPGVLVCKMSGYLDVSNAKAFEDATIEPLPDGRNLDIFFDTESLVGTDPDFRRRMTRWHRELSPRTRSLHVLVGSKRVAMDVAVVNASIGGLLRPWVERNAFETALRSVIRQRT
jgi:hypothetical protein